jgi:hypothetical protein
MTKRRYQITDTSPLLTSFSEIFENIYRLLYHHIYCNHILVHEQFGFRNNSSTEIASYKLINDILSSLNNKLQVGGISMIY